MRNKCTGSIVNEERKNRGNEKKNEMKNTKRVHSRREKLSG